MVSLTVRHEGEARDADSLIVAFAVVDLRTGGDKIARCPTIPTVAGGHAIVARLIQPDLLVWLRCVPIRLQRLTARSSLVLVPLTRPR